MLRFRTQRFRDVHYVAVVYLGLDSLEVIALIDKNVLAQEKNVQ